MPSDIRIRFGRAIRRLRERQGISQEEAAERCGLHRTYYSGIERGVRNLPLVTIEKIAKGQGNESLRLRREQATREATNTWERRIRRQSAEQ